MAVHRAVTLDLFTTDRFIPRKSLYVLLASEQSNKILHYMNLPINFYHQVLTARDHLGEDTNGHKNEHCVVKATQLPGCC